MVNYSSYEGKLIQMAESYPIYSREDDYTIIGYTDIGDMAVITHSDLKADYHEVIITSGKYMGVDTLALFNDDLKKSVFVFNNIDKGDVVYIKGKKVKSVFV